MNIYLLKNKRFNHTIIFIIMAIVVISLFLKVNNVLKTSITMTEYKQMPTIIIDAGHGGFDGGAIGLNNIIEKDINLDIATKLRDILMINGFDVVMIREGDCALNDSGLSRIRDKKKSDMNNRLKIIKQYPNGIFVSIHQNKFEQQSSKGTQIFYSKNNNDSETFAHILQSNFVSILQPENHRKEKKSGKEYFLLYNTEIPAVLIECGFISNQMDACNLVDNEHQQKISLIIYKSLMDFIYN